VVVIENVHRTHDWQVEESQPSMPAFDEIDRRLIEESPDHPDALEVAKALDRESRCSVAGEAVLRALELLMPSERLSKKTAHTMGVRAVCLLWAIGSSKHEIGNQSMAALARRIGTSRALLSHWIRTYERQLGLHVRGQKSVTGSQSYVESSLRGWETRRRRAVVEDEEDHAADLQAVAD
jgi:transposase-like protein